MQPGYALVPADWLASMIEPARTALVVVDVQVDFVSPEGAMAAAGIDLAPLEAPLQKLQSLLAAARAVGVRPVFLRVVTRPDTDSAAQKLRNERLGYPPEALDVCRAGTPGADYHRVRPQPREIEIEKPLYSGFAGTALDAHLRAAGIDTLLFTGFTTECCVDSSVRDAFHRDYHCFVVTDACAAYSAHLHEGALEALALNCALMADTACVLQAWRQETP